MSPETLPHSPETDEKTNSNTEGLTSRTLGTRSRKVRGKVQLLLDDDVTGQLSKRGAAN